MRLLSVCLSHSLTEHQTNLNYSTLLSHHFPLSIIVEEEYDIRSRSKLCQEQHKDPELSPLFQKAISETDLTKDSICFYIRTGILMLLIGWLFWV